MALVAVTNGQSMVGSQVQQLIDLLKGVMTDQPVTLTHASANPLIVNRSDAAGIKGLITGQRAAATKWLMGLDASDQWAVLNAAGAAVNLGSTDLGDVTARAQLTAPSHKITGLTGAGAGNTRIVGSTSGGPPTSGTFVVGDLVYDRTYFGWWACTTGGTSGTWRAIGPMRIQRLSGASATYDFASIPAFWQGLELRFNLRDTSATNGITTCQVRCNASSAAFYQSSDAIFRSNTAVASPIDVNNAAQATFTGLMAGGGLADSAAYCMGKATIRDYINAGGQRFLGVTEAAVYLGNSAVTSLFNDICQWTSQGFSGVTINEILLMPASGFDANSWCELWGIP